MINLIMQLLFSRVFTTPKVSYSKASVCSGIVMARYLRLLSIMSIRLSTILSHEHGCMTFIEARSSSQECNGIRSVPVDQQLNNLNQQVFWPFGLNNTITPCPYIVTQLDFAIGKLQDRLHRTNFNAQVSNLPAFKELFSTQ